MCTTLEKQVGSYTNATSPFHGERLWELCGDGNFLSMFCPELQKLLKPINDLPRKWRPFILGKEQQYSFYEIKCRLLKPQVLHMPNKTGIFHLYSDTSKFATGSALYQIQNGKPKLIVHLDNN